jgi:hypothetical protein
MIIMGRLTRGLGGQAGTHDDYYAINPRRVSGMVEKSKKKPFCDAKFDKKRVFLGDRVLEPQRERSIINDLRAPQATHDLGRYARTLRHGAPLPETTSLTPEDRAWIESHFSHSAHRNG